jgi:hypothetical protein
MINVTSSPLYYPPNCKTLADMSVKQQIRLGIQGAPGVGKTTSALTFPNPMVLNLDRGLSGHIGRADVIEIPFYDVHWVRTWLKKLSYNKSELKDALIQWIESECMRISPEQTLIIDGNTGLANAYHNWWDANRNSFLTSRGVVDELAEWSVKKKFFGQIMEALKTLKCDVVYICHEAEQRDKVPVGSPVSYSGKLKPLLSGGFVDELASHFTDWFRQHSAAIPNDENEIKEELIQKNWKMSKQDFLTWCKSFPNGTIYYWQTVGDNVFDAKNSSLTNAPRYVPSSYSTYMKYCRKLISVEKRETLGNVTAQ